MMWKSMLSYLFLLFELYLTFGNHLNDEDAKQCSSSSNTWKERSIERLRNINKYYHIEDTLGNQYYVNLFGSTVNESHCQARNVSVCVKNGPMNETQILGLASRELIKIEPFHLEYRCNQLCSNKKTSVIILLICNSTVERETLTFLNHTKNHHYFELESKHACIEEVERCCTDHKNQIYNLSPLKTKNHVIFDRENKKYILRICSAVEHSQCPKGAILCLENGNTSRNLGSVLTGPKMTDSLTIVSSGGDMCDEGIRYSTIVQFHCSQTDEDPILLNTSDCVHTIKWNTKAACPYTLYVGKNDCRARDPIRGIDFNLDVLRGSEDYFVDGTSGEKFHLNLCGPLVKPCNGSTDVGVCLTDSEGKQHGIGEIADSPQYNSGRLSFDLAGSKCSLDKDLIDKRFRVIIRFVCVHDKSRAESSPHFFEKNQSNCSYIFVWPTTAACPPYQTYNCTTLQNSPDGEVFDLSPLMFNDHDYVLWYNQSNSFKKIIINICQPVMFGYDSGCSPESGVCVKNLEEPNHLESFTGFGRASNIYFDESKVLKVEYLDGDFCNLESSLGRIPAAHSVITFICDREVPSGGENITLVNVSSCVLEFEMRTRLACSKNREAKKDPVLKGSFSEGVISNEMLHFEECSLNNRKHITLDFLPLCNKTYNVASYTIRLNSSLINSEVQKKEAATYGRISSAKINSPEYQSVLFTFMGTLCATNTKEKTRASINFLCSTDEEGKPFILNETNCSVDFQWNTSAACPQVFASLSVTSSTAKTTTAATTTSTAKTSTTTATKSISTTTKITSTPSTATFAIYNANTLNYSTSTSGTSMPSTSPSTNYFETEDLSLTPARSSFTIVAVIVAAVLIVLIILGIYFTRMAKQTNYIRRFINRNFRSSNEGYENITLLNALYRKEP